MRRTSFSLWLAAILALPGAGASHAQTAPPSHLQEMMEEERRLVHPSEHRTDCQAEDPLNKAIVVCAPDRSQHYRVPSSSDDPHNRAATRGGAPTPPDVYGGPSCDRGCIRGGYAPPPVYYIDLSKIPEAPPGSDADKIAKGEMRAP